MESDNTQFNETPNPVPWINRNAVWILLVGFGYLFVKAVAGGDGQDVLYALGTANSFVFYFGIRWMQKYLFDI